MNLREQYEAETGKGSTYQIHENDAGFKVPSMEYVQWLEAKVNAQSTPPEVSEEWISVEDDMPKKTGCWYIGWSNKRKAIPVFLDNTQDANNKIDGTIWMGIDGELGEDEEITHWRYELNPPTK